MLSSETNIINSIFHAWISRTSKFHFFCENHCSLSGMRLSIVISITLSILSVVLKCCDDGGGGEEKRRERDGEPLENTWHKGKGGRGEGGRETKTPHGTRRRRETHTHKKWNSSSIKGCQTEGRKKAGPACAQEEGRERGLDGEQRSTALLLSCTSILWGRRQWIDGWQFEEEEEEGEEWEWVGTRQEEERRWLAPTRQTE